MNTRSSASEKAVCLPALAGFFFGDEDLMETHMDFFDVVPEDQEVDIFDTKGNPVGLTFVLRPKHSKEVQDAIARQRREAYEATRKNRDLFAVADKHAPLVLAAYIKGHKWGEKPQIHGNQVSPVDFDNKDNLKRLFTEKQFEWIVSQIDRAIGDEAGFFQD